MVSKLCSISFLNPVNEASLACEDQQRNAASDPTEDNRNAVCATNGVTYPSLCRLLQDTGNEAVAYAGECGREECEGGPVSDLIIGYIYIYSA